MLHYGMLATALHAARCKASRLHQAEDTNATGAVTAQLATLCVLGTPIYADGV